MAGVGIKLKRIYEKKSITADIFGIGYSVIITIAPMLFIVASVLVMENMLGFGNEDYLIRDLFSCTILYIFVFSLLAVHLLFSPVLSRYVQDAIFEERYDDVMPCYQTGLLLTLLLGCIPGIIFCFWEYFIGGVGAGYVFLGYCGYTAMIFVLYSMSYLSVCKDFERISLFFFVGMAVSLLLALFLRLGLHWDIAHSMLFSLVIGFLLIGALEYAALKNYFPKSSGQYRPVFTYCRKWWKLMVANFFYVLGLYIHNFVFWTHESREIIARSFICNQNYDVAAYIAIFTNISTLIIFISRVEMNFNKKYKTYSEAVIGGKRGDIDTASSRMFRQLSEELTNLVRLQFIITVVAYLLFTVLLPQFGFAGSIMRIYPCLAAGFFILFIMYAAMHFLYYFNDFMGAVLTSAGFCVMTFLGSLFAMRLSETWYGVGVVLGAFTGWTIAYIRLRWIERNLNTHIFCQGVLMRQEKQEKPDSKVYDKKAEMMSKQEGAIG